MLTKIKKRDGREADFDSQKITDAIYKARCAVGQKDIGAAAALAVKVTERLEEAFGESAPAVEDIQDIVEQVLMEYGHAVTAKQYILYRAERTRIREMNMRLMKVFEEITFKSAGDSDIKRENANIDGNTAMGAMLKYGSEGAKEFYSKFVLKPEHAKAHADGDIQIHDMDFYTLTTTCCQIDIKKLFSGGFSTGHGHLREPNDIQSYAALACIAIQSNQNDQHGGQSIVNFDYGMSDGVAKTYKRLYQSNLQKAYELLSGEDVGKEPFREAREAIEAEEGLFPRIGCCEAYAAAEHARLAGGAGLDGGAGLETGAGLDEGARFGGGASPQLDAGLLRKAQAYAAKKADEEIDRNTYQAMEAFIHNLNTMHSRAGAQTPFSSINYGMDTSPEGRLVIKNILLATEAGLGHGETAIFPIQIFRVKKGVNYDPGDPNYDLLKLSFRVSAKRMYPNYSFQDAPFNAQYYKPGRPETEIAYMGCRTRVIANVYDPSQEISNGRGNLSFTSINLPRLAIKANRDIEVFFEDLERKLNMATDQLLERFEIQARKTAANFPFLIGQGVWLGSEKLRPGQELREALKHGTLSIGFIGLAECLAALTGQHHAQSAESQNLGLEIVGFMRQYTDSISKRLGMNFTLIATPAEGLSGRFVRLDRQKYGVIDGVTDKEYYTNSFHVPVSYAISAYDKIMVEAPYHALTNAGHITYVELDGDVSSNIEAFERIVRAMFEAGIGYGSINHPVDRDPICGYTGVIGDECPQCGRRESEPCNAAAEAGSASKAGAAASAGCAAYATAADPAAVPFERIRRITGYLVGTLDRFNNAKRAEERDRVKHGL